MASRLLNFVQAAVNCKQRGEEEKVIYRIEEQTICLLCELKLYIVYCIHCMGAFLQMCFFQICSARLQMEDKRPDLQDHKISKRLQLQDLFVKFQWHHHFENIIPLYHLSSPAFKVSQRRLWTRQLQKPSRWGVMIQMFFFQLLDGKMMPN